MLQDAGAERFRPIFSALLKNEERGVWLAGALLADGLGEDALLRPWAKSSTAALRWAWRGAARYCAQAWEASGQGQRRELLRRALDEAAADSAWMQWLRVWEWRRDAGLGMASAPPRQGLLAPAILRGAGGEARSAPEMAAGRFWCGGVPLWPADPFEAGLLQLWPGARRLAGQRFQGMAAAGAEEASIRGVSRVLLRPRETRPDAGDRARDLARDWASDLASDLARDWGLPNDAPWLLDLARVELWSFGRAGARFAAAYGRPRNPPPAFGLLQAACRLSFHPERDPGPLDDALASFLGDPLWPALAKRLARRSTPEERALLEELARHPERREPPLSWGLQYIVRGDVLLEDGTELTLDELCDQHGLPRLPYLEEMPPELEVDWKE